MPFVSESSSSKAPTSQDFVREQVEADLASNRYGGRVVTRFPPEPNGYLHIGHAKAICIDFGVAKDYQGRCHLRMDDTNPAKEDTEFVESIQADIRWLGFDWGEHLYFASDYFERLYGYAEQLIEKGLAYVCSLPDEEIRSYRGSLTEAGKNSPYRDRSVEENLDLFRRMRAGEFKDGEHVLRAKIDMSAANMKLRDPLLYRIRHVHHHRTGDKWCIYPLYDYAHCVSDAIEGVTHSLCSLEFENNRDVYDWVLEKLEFPAPPHQYEFARLNLTGTVMSKRKLAALIEERAVSGWDDPRMPTLAGMRRRGYTPEAIREFCARVGIAKAHSVVDMSLLEFCLRDDLNERSPRVMCVQSPLEAEILNFEEQVGERDGEGVHWIDAPYWPHNIDKEEHRKLPFTSKIIIDQEDFQEDPPKGFFRLKPGGVVRLRHAGVVQCEEVIHDAAGKVASLKLRLLSEKEQEGVKVKGTIQWLSQSHCANAELRLFDRLVVPDSSEQEEVLNPRSLQVVKAAKIELSLKDAPPARHFQFERMGYFYSDPQDHGSERCVFNRTVTLKDTWAKKKPAEAPKAPPAAKATKSAAISGGRAKAKSAKLSKTEQRKRALEASPAAQAMLKRLIDEHGLDQEDAEILATREHFGDLLLRAVDRGAKAKAVAKWLVNDLVRDAKDPSAAAQKLDGGHLAELLAMVEGDEINGQIAKVVFGHMLQEGESPAAIVKAKNLSPIREPSELRALLEGVMQTHPDKVQAYRGGNAKLAGFFLGQCVKQSGGRADATALKGILEEVLQG